MMKRKCNNCDFTKFDIYPNNLCQKCLSKRLENELIKKGKDLKLLSEKLIQEYIIDRKSIRQIAKENNSKPFQIRKLLELYRIPVRLSLEKEINHSVFKKLNPESAYLLGYIFTDGNLVLNKTSKNYFLQIYSKYKYQLDNGDIVDIRSF